MANRFMLTGMVALFWVQPCLAHDSLEEIAAANAKEVEQQRVREQQQQQYKITLSHTAFQEYTRLANHQEVHIKVFPPSKKLRHSSIQVLVKHQDKIQTNITSVSLLLMNSGKKILMQKIGSYFQSHVTFPTTSQTIIMIKIKNANQQTYFVKFTY